MKLLLSILSSALAFSLFFVELHTGKNTISQPLINQSTESFAIVGVNVIPMTDENLILENHTVIINGDQISQIRPAEEDDFKEGTFNSSIIASGKYLMPGLAEMHGHVPPTHPPENAPSYFDEDYVESTLFLYVAAGVTTVRGMLGYEHQLELKDKVGPAENWKYIGPKLFLAGPSFNGNTVTSPEQGAERVRDHKKEGWDLLKIHPGLTIEEYDAIANTAHETGIAFGGHVPEEVGIVHALEMKQETIDHLDGYIAYLSKFEGAEQEAKMDEIIRKTIENDVWVVPTMALWETIIGAANYKVMAEYEELKYIPPAVRKNYDNWSLNNVINNAEIDRGAAKEHAALRLRLLNKMSQAGVKILMGTDAPQLYSVPGYSIHRELKKMKDAGISEYDILKTGSSNLEEYLKGGGYTTEWGIGTVEKGNLAQLILLNSNPLENIDNLKDLAGVGSMGRWYSREIIDKKLAEIEKMYAE